MLLGKIEAGGLAFVLQAAADRIAGRRRARIGIAASGSQADPVLMTAELSAELEAHRPTFVGEAATNRLAGWRTFGAGIRKTGAGAHVRATLGGTVLGSQMLADGFSFMR